MTPDRTALLRWQSRAVDTLAELSAYLATFADHRTVCGRELAEALKSDVDGLVRDGAHLRLAEQLAASVKEGTEA